jgi:hypothetical protein
VAAADFPGYYLESAFKADFSTVLEGVKQEAARLTAA